MGITLLSFPSQLSGQGIPFGDKGIILPEDILISMHANTEPPRFIPTAAKIDIAESIVMDNKEFILRQPWATIGGSIFAMYDNIMVQT